jgi:hypothetical protein
MRRVKYAGIEIDVSSLCGFRLTPRIELKYTLKQSGYRGIIRDTVIVAFLIHRSPTSCKRHQSEDYSKTALESVSHARNTTLLS